MAEAIKKIDLLEEKSEMVQEIMERKPTWIVLWGTTFILFAIVVAVFLLWLIKYPDIIVAKITITHSSPPIQLVSKASGPVIFLHSDNERVNQNQPIGYIKNSVDFIAVQTLKDSLKSIITEYNSIQDSVRTSFLGNFTNLGTIQSDVNRLNEFVRKYQFINYNHPIDKEIESLENQLENYRNLDDLLSERIVTSTRQFVLAEKDFQRDKKLFNENVISPKDFENKEKELLGVKSLLENAHLQKRENLISISEVKTLLQRVKNEQELTESELKSNIENAAKELISNITTWEDKYVLKSPCDGTLSFFKYWKDEQFVLEGTEILTIIPEIESIVIGRIESPVYNSGKIKIGQRVNVLLDSYPYQEYGQLVGTVESISPLPRNEVLLVTITLNDGLVTSFKRQLELNQEITGQAEIVTEDIRLIERLFYQITKAVR